MIINIPLSHGLSLRIVDAPHGGKLYPTTGLQKGLILLDHGQELDEEGVGFGVPVLKCGLNTIFPGAVELTLQQNGSTWEILAQFNLNLVEKISRGDNEFVENRLLYGVKNLLAAMIRRVIIARRLLTSTSSSLRRMLKWETNYAYSGFSDVVNVIYRIEAEQGKLTVEINPGSLRPQVTEVVVMNELGAGHFDRYGDSSGAALRGEEIGCWDEVSAEQSWFESSSHKLAFKLRQIKAARLFRGRELIGARLAWAGFGYSFSPSIKNLQYVIRFERTP